MYRNPNTKYRNQKGTSIPEFGASLLFLPFLFLVIFAAVQFTHAYIIRAELSAAARQAARDIAIQYGVDSTSVTTRSQQDSVVFNNIRLYPCVTKSSQFSDAYIFTKGAGNTARKYVTITANYVNTQNGQLYRDISGWLKMPDKLSESSTYRLEGN